MVVGESPGKPLVRFDGVSRRFRAVSAVDNVTLDIHQGEFFALLGPSGCGKTTLLRMLAGFERPDEGRVWLAGEDITGNPPHRRPVNMMFQSYALFPHLSVEDNVAFGLKQEGLARDEIAGRVAAMLKLVRLEGYGVRKPDQLSGGQRQRVALARSLIKRPRVLLLDEPFAALDKKLREETRFELKQLQRELGLTFVIVTHDQEEAMVVVDRIAVMNAGALAQVGTPGEVYERPASRWVAEFVGNVSIIEGAAAGGRQIEGDGGLPLHVADCAAQPGEPVVVALRPEKIVISGSQPPGSDNAFPGVVLDVGYLGAVSLYKVKLDNGTVLKAGASNVTRAGRTFSPGDRVWLSFAPDACVVLPR